MNTDNFYVTSVDAPPSVLRYLIAIYNVSEKGYIEIVAQFERDVAGKIKK